MQTVEQLETYSTALYALRTEFVGGNAVVKFSKGDTHMTFTSLDQINLEIRSIDTQIELLKANECLL